MRCGLGSVRDDGVRCGLGSVRDDDGVRGYNTSLLKRMIVLGDSDMP